MRCIFFLVSFCWVQMVFAQKENIRKINPVFSYQESRPYVGQLWIAGRQQPIQVQQVGPAYQGYIWIKVKHNWRLIDSLNHRLEDSTTSISRLEPCANGKNTWASTSQGWILFNYQGKKLTEPFEYFTTFSRDWYILYKDDRWLVGSQEGKTGTKTFSSYKSINAKKNMLMVTTGGGTWQLYDCSADELGKETYTNFQAHNEFVLVEKENRHWSCMRVENLDAREMSVQGIPHVAGDTASGFFVREKTGWNLFAYTNPQNSVKSYDSVLFNLANQTSFALKNNQWMLVDTHNEKKLCLKKNELAYLTTPTDPSTIAFYQRSKVATQVQQEFYNHGLDPDMFAEFEVSRPVAWYGDPSIYLFKAGGRMGLCNMEQSRLSVLPLYSKIEVLSSGYYRATYPLAEMGYTYNAIGLVDREGKILVPFHYLSIVEIWNADGTGRMLVAELASQVYDFYDEQGKKMNDQPVNSVLEIHAGSKLEKSCDQYTLLVEGGKDQADKQYRFTWNETSGRYTLLVSDREKTKDSSTSKTK